MKNWVVTGNLLVVLGLFGLSCQPEKKSRVTQDMPEKLIIASVPKPTYTVGDSIAIQLAQPLSRVAVWWDGASISAPQSVADSLTIGTRGKTVGLHQVVVRGETTGAQSITNTLTVELLSDIIPPEKSYTVQATYPHDTASFTQGLEFYRGRLYESTGLNGKSRLMTIDLPTGKAIQTVSLPNQHFGEGITVVNNKIYQLTWTSGLCFRYKPDFTLEKTLVYHTQGWGLTHQDSTLILSDGSNKLYFYTPELVKLKELSVYDDKGPVVNLNELEYVNGCVFSNIWQTNRIVQIDAASGKVVAYLNMERILPPSIDPKENVLNGIAYNPQEKALFVTGKNWPTLLKIQLKEPIKTTKNPLASR